jgi:oxygen-dependent protoporphyrinogen oxidase
MSEHPANGTLYDNLIIGGGISGLGLVHLCRRQGLKTLLLERDDSFGGCIHSEVFEGTEGFWAEMGSHTCYNSYGNLLSILDDLGMGPALKLKRKVSFKVLEQNRLVSVFSRLNLAEAAVSLPRLFFTNKDGKSVQQFYSRVLGTRNYRQLFGPAFNAVICQPAGDFPADMLFRKKPRRKDMPRSFTLDGGLSAITTAIAGQSGIECLTGAEVAHVRRCDEGFEVGTVDERQFRARRLSLAVPPDAAAALLADLAPEVSRHLAEIEMSAIESVSVAVLQLALDLDPLAGIIAPDAPFYAAVSRDYLDDGLFRGFTFHFQPDQLSDEEKMQRICQVLRLAPEDIQSSRSRLNRLPALRVGHRDRVAAIDRALADTGIALTGNYFIGVSIEDCLTRSAAEFARLFAA